jgi:hypothetical protein
MDCRSAEVCAQLPADSFCVRTCTTGNDCAAGEVCYATTTFNGQIIGACIEHSGICSANPPGLPDSGVVTTDAGTAPVDGGPELHPLDAGPAPDTDAGSSSNDAGFSSGDAGLSGYCNGLAGPDVSGTGCTCARPGSCAANNCYGGWYCDPSTDSCVAPPANCSGTAGTDAGTTGFDAGTSGRDAGPASADAGPFSSNVTASGGTESELYFAIVGDTRPPNPDDTAGYPTAIITKIYEDIQNLNPRPPFVVSTGDYQYITSKNVGSCGSYTLGGAQATQLGDYQTARNGYSGIYWPAMGNHECTGYTASECGSGNADGITDNYCAWSGLFLTPIGESLPYYSRTITANDGSWTAHFIFVALNYWSSAQQSWLTQQLAQSATYTFVIHHESSSAGSPSALSTVERMERSVETLSIVGHSHTWVGSSGSKELLVGNGGAPLTGSGTYGYTTVLRQSNGSLVVTNYDYQSNQVKNTFTVP